MTCRIYSVEVCVLLPCCSHFVSSGPSVVCVRVLYRRLSAWSWGYVEELLLSSFEVVETMWPGTSRFWKAEHLKYIHRERHWGWFSHQPGLQVIKIGPRRKRVNIMAVDKILVVRLRAFVNNNKVPWSSDWLPYSSVVYRSILQVILSSPFL